MSARPQGQLDMEKTAPSFSRSRGPLRQEQEVSQQQSHRVPNIYTPCVSNLCPFSTAAPQRTLKPRTRKDIKGSDSCKN